MSSAKRRERQRLLRSRIDQRRRQELEGKLAEAEQILRDAEAREVRAKRAMQEVEKVLCQAVASKLANIGSIEQWGTDQRAIPPLERITDEGIERSALEVLT